MRVGHSKETHKRKKTTLGESRKLCRRGKTLNIGDFIIKPISAHMDKNELPQCLRAPWAFFVMQWASINVPLYIFDWKSRSLQSRWFKLKTKKLTIFKFTIMTGDDLALECWIQMAKIWMKWMSIKYHWHPYPRRKISTRWISLIKSVISVTSNFQYSTHWKLSVNSKLQSCRSNYQANKFAQ